MTLQTLNFFDLSQIATSNPAGFSDNGGYHFAPGVDTVTLTTMAISHVLSVNDTADAFFDDDPAGTQTLNSAQAVNGTVWPAGTVIEAEYILHVQDAQGQIYTLQFVSLNGDAYNIQGFVVQGAVPPFGQALTVTGAQDWVTGVYPYAGSSPNCFAAASCLATPAGPVPAGRLRRGMAVILADGGLAEVALVLRSVVTTGGDAQLCPVEIAAGAFGPGLPRRALRLSRQHRIVLPDLPGLVAAGALLGVPGVRLCRGVAQIDYVHVVLARHAILCAEGLGCESFWPGPVALAALPAALAGRVRAVMGPAPQRALPFWSRAAALRLLQCRAEETGGPAGAAHRRKSPRQTASAASSSGISTSP